MRTAVAFTRKLVFRGLFTLLPLAITFWLMYLLFGFVNDLIAPWVGRALELAGVQNVQGGWWKYVVPMVGLVVLFAILVLVGLLATNLFGKRLLAVFERLLLSIPLVRAIYGSAKQLIEAITIGGQSAFREVVAFEYPRRGIWVLGFVTSSMPGSSLSEEIPEMVNVFLPTTPNPTSGFLLILPTTEVHHLPISVEEGIKMIVSGGLVLPPSMMPAGKTLPEPRR